MEIQISEKIIEDILTTDKTIVSEILGVNYSDLDLLSRQKIVDSGILDMLYICKDKLLLIELKVVPFYDQIISQITGYHQDLLKLQKQNKIIGSRIELIILVVKAKSEDYIKCKKNDMQLLTYDPKHILSKYYENFKELSYFLKVQSGDFGVVRLALLNTTLHLLGEEKSLQEISLLEDRSTKTIRKQGGKCN